MGADIYLNSVYNKSNEHAERKYKRALTLRDQATGKASVAQHQVQVDKYYDLINDAGYFRDSYNHTSLFWILGLSWWELYEELCNEEGFLPIHNARILVNRILHVSIYDNFPNWETERKTAGWTFSDKGNSTNDWINNFIDKKYKLINLLEQSIKLDEPLLWSV